MGKKIIFSLLLALFISAVFALPFTEDFTDNQMPPTGWSIEAGPGTLGTSEYTHAGGAAPQGYINGWPQSIGTTRLISPVQDVSSYSELQLEFKHAVNSATYGNFSLKIETTSDGGTTWNEVWSFAPTAAYFAATETLAISNADLGSENFQFCLTYEANALQAIYHAYFDDFVLTGTEAPQNTLPFAEDFSAGIEAWTVSGGGDANWGVMYNSNAGGTSPEAWFGWNPAFSGTSYLTSPVLETTGLTALDLEYKHYMDDYASGYSIGVATTSDGGTSWNVVNEVDVTGDVGPETLMLSVTTPDVGSSTFQLGFFFNGSTTQINNYFIDDVTLVEGEATTFAAPANLLVTDLGYASWDAPVASRVLQGYNVSLDGAFIAYTTDMFYEYTGLVNDTSYLAEVTAVYDDPGESDPIEFTFTYLESASAPLPFTEDFTDNLMPPTGWSIEAGPGTLGTSEYSHAGGTAPQGYINGWPQSIGTTRLISPVQDVSSYSELQLEFKHSVNSATYGDFSLKIETTSDGGTTWNEVWSVTPTGYYAGVTETIAITNADLGSANFQFCLAYETNALQAIYHAYFDDFVLTEASITTYSLTYNVEDADENPISGAEIALEGYGSMTTDASGQAIFTGVEAGTYTYDITAAGFIAESGSTIVTDADVIVDVVMTAEAVEYTLPFSEDFAENLCPAEDWSIVGEDNGNWITWSSSSAGGEAPEGCFYWNPNFNGNSKMVSPEITTSGNTALNLEFKHYLNDWTGGYNLKVETTSDGGTTWNEVWSILADGSIPAETVTILINNADVGSDNFQFALTFDGQTNINGWFFDDIVLTESSSFAAPANLLVTNLGYATWEAPVATRALLGYNVSLDGVFVAYTTDMFYEYTALVNETSYLAEVTAVYDDPGESDPIEYNFTYVESASNTLPFTEDFSSGLDEWSVIGGGDANWVLLNNNNAGGTLPEADFSWNPNFSGVSYLTTPVLETTGLTALELEYKHYMWNYIGSGYSIGVATTSNGGVTWHVVDEVFPTADIGPETVNLSIANTDVGSSTFQLAFFFSGSTTQINAWFIDDVSITEGVATFNPATNLFVDDTGYATWEAPIESARNFKTNTIVDQRINASKNNNLNDNFTNNSNREFSGYNVYLDGDLVANTTDLSYQFTDLADANSYLASVTAVYDDPGESYAVEYQFVYNPGTINPPYNLFVDETGYASWEDLNNPEPNGIYSQLDNVSPEGGISAQVFVEMYTAYNSEGADEFVVPAGETWTINQVLILGSGPTHAMELANICFYEDDNGLPGDLLFDYPETAVAYSFDGDLNCIIPNTEFTEGTYWMGAQGFSYGDQWFWERQVAPTIGYEFCFRNPGDGFGSGHTNWVTASTHWPNNFDHNLSFGLYGAITDATGRVQIMAYDSNITKRSIETKSILDQDRKIAGTPLLSNKSSIRNSRNLLGYNIYLDGVNVAWTDGLYYQYSNLVHGTTYLAEVTALYDEGETVPTEYEFTYYEPSGLLPYTDDFSNGFDNWTIQGDGNWVVLANNYAGGDIPEAQFSWDPTYTGVSYLKSPIFDTSGYAVLNMEYKQYMWDYLGSGYSIGVATTSDGGVTWNIADEVFPTGDIGPDIFMINIATPDVGSDAFQFAFFFSGSTTQINHWFVDDVSVVGDPFSPPNNYTAEVQNFNDVLLTWDAPTGSAAPVNKVDKQISASSKDINLAKAHTDELRDLVCFTLYRDGIEIACLMSDSYEFLDTGLDAGDYEYTIIASYNDGDSYSVGPVAVTITLPAPTNLTATSEEADISLTWQAPTTSTRDIATYNLYRDSALIAEGITSLTYTDSALPNGTYVYEVAVVYDGDWEGDLSDSFEIVHDASGVEDVLPLVTKLSGNYPNPFNPTTNIRFALHQNSKVTIDVYNIKGEKVCTLLNGELEAGNHNIEWNGKDAQNKTVASGIFFYKMKAGEFSSIRKMILMK